MRVQTRTNADQVAGRMRRRAAALQVEFAAAEKSAGTQAHRLAVRYSSGTATPRGKDHPYSRRRPHATQPWIANVRTGRLRSSWRLRQTKTPDGWRFALSNSSPEARFFNGQPTARMIARPLLQQVMKEIRGVRLSGEVKAMRKAMRTP